MRIVRNSIKLNSIPVDNVKIASLSRDFSWYAVNSTQVPPWDLS